MHIHTKAREGKQLIDEVLEDAKSLQIALTDLLRASPTINHPGGKIRHVLVTYEDESTQMIFGDVVENAVYEADRRLNSLFHKYWRTP
jgi:hypothetical protein